MTKNEDGTVESSRSRRDFSEIDFTNNQRELELLKLQLNSNEGVNLKGANLTGVNLEGANLFTADLTGANLFGANLSGADFEGANLTETDMRLVKLVRTGFDKTIFEGANIKGIIAVEGFPNADSYIEESFTYDGKIFKFRFPPGASEFQELLEAKDKRDIFLEKIALPKYNEESERRQGSKNNIFLVQAENTTLIMEVEKMTDGFSDSRVKKLLEGLDLNYFDFEDEH